MLSHGVPHFTEQGTEILYGPLWTLRIGDRCIGLTQSACKQLDNWIVWDSHDEVYHPNANQCRPHDLFTHIFLQIRLKKINAVIIN
jgi:hypothetical protein